MEATNHQGTPAIASRGFVFFRLSKYSGDPEHTGKRFKILEAYRVINHTRS